MYVDLCLVDWNGLATNRIPFFVNDAIVFWGERIPNSWRESHAHNNGFLQSLNFLTELVRRIVVHLSQNEGQTARRPFLKVARL